MLDEIVVVLLKGKQNSFSILRVSIDLVCLFYRYIEAIESRLHRMEALLGGLLQNDDPRAQALLGELIGSFFLVVPVFDIVPD